MHSLNKVALTLAVSSLAFIAGCSDSNNTPKPVVGPASAPFQELYDQGITRYQGDYSPMITVADGDVMNYTFGAGDGPLCLDGSQYTMATRDKGSDELVIFLQGGGACWSELCAATTSASTGIPKVGILDPDLPNNPVGDWSTVYLPYCDGGLHASDRDSDSTGDGQLDRFQRGLHNLSAALDVAVTTFPSPRRILLTGISAGGFGSTYALPLVRSLYPGIPIEVINDSGLGIARPDEPAFVELLMNDWNMSAFIPASCDTCIGDDGHTTDYLKWQLAQDPNIRLSLMSYKQDATIAITFVQVGGEAFEQELIPELKDIESTFPTRVATFVADGNAHTFLLDDIASVTAGGVTVLEWVTAMLEQSDQWVSVTD